MKHWSNQPVADLAGAEKLVQEDIDWVLKGDAMVWSITKPPSDKALGKFIFFQFSHENRRAEVGYVLNRDHWRQGLMTEVLTRMLEFAFEDLDLHRLEADIDNDNHASLRLLQKLGFIREGLFRQRWCVYGEWTDSVMLGLLKTDWSKSGISTGEAR
jgi:RimJ/RimL family protein N-acetyltransferase